MTKYEIGDLFKSDLTGRTYEVKSFVEVGRETHYFMVSEWDALAMNEGFISRNWTKIEPFFEEGEIYFFASSGDRTPNYLIKDVRQVGGMMWAWAEKIHFGAKSMVTLTPVDFEAMEQL